MKDADIEWGRYTPIHDGRWEEGDEQRGNSVWIPEDSTLRESLKKYGKKGVEYKNGVPDFEPFGAYETYLTPKEYQIRNLKQFEVCNENMSEYYEKKAKELAGDDLDNPLDCMEYRDFLKKSFKCDEEQLEEIQNALDVCETPYGYVWHHDTQKGRMILIPSSIHSIFHIGGQSIWGGGTTRR